MEKKVTSPAVKGIIISLILIVFSLIIMFLDLSKNKALSASQFLVFIGGVIWSAVFYAKQLDGNVTFGNTFAHAFKVTAAVTAIMVVYTVLSLKFINPEQLEAGIQEARAGMEAKNMSDDQIDNAINLTRKFATPFAIAGVLIMFMFIGVISSLIGAAVAKKNPRDPFVQPQG
jgi:NADH:ubiquinone oxidoreductase subunit 6 (subunit J)